jgi:hypothetical protein
MIDEMMLAFDSPGSGSKALIVTLLFMKRQCEGQNGHEQTEMFCAGVGALLCAPNWLAAESVSPYQLRLPPRSLLIMQA